MSARTIHDTNPRDREPFLQTGTHRVRAVRPYPYETWPRLSADEARWLRDAAHKLPREFARALAESALVLGVVANLREGAFESCTAEAARDALRPPRVALAFELEAGANLLPVVCELSPELAACVVDRTLGGNGVVTHPPGEALDDLSAGALAYLAARLCAASGTALRIHSVFTDASEARAQLGERRVLVWPLSFSLGPDHRGWLRVFIPEATVRACSSTPAARSTPAPWLQGLQLPVCAHAARVTLRQSELRALRLGDVIVPERIALTCDGKQFQGQAELHVIGARRGAWHCEVGDRQLVLGAPITLDPEFDMSETRRIGAPLTPVNAELGELPIDAPIELCLELARFSLPLEQVSALRPGQVLSSATAIGQAVTLSASGRPIARGELVDLDGEIGLRILELANG